MANQFNILDPGLRNVLLRDVTGETSTSTTEVFLNQFYRGIELITSVTVAPGVDTIALSLFGVDPISGKLYLLGSGATISVASPTVANVVIFYPGIDIIPTIQFSKLLPVQFLIVIAHVGVGAFDYTISANLRP